MVLNYSKNKNCFHFLPVVCLLPFARFYSLTTPDHTTTSSMKGVRVCWKATLRQHSAAVCQIYIQNPFFQLPRNPSEEVSFLSLPPSLSWLSESIPWDSEKGGVGVEGGGGKWKEAKDERQRAKDWQTERWGEGGGTESCSYLLKYSCWCQQLFHSLLGRGLLFDTSIALSLFASHPLSPPPPSDSLN